MLVFVYTNLLQGGLQSCRIVRGPGGHVLNYGSFLPLRFTGRLQVSVSGGICLVSMCSGVFYATIQVK
jgi:hypothetical protein